MPTPNFYAGGYAAPHDLSLWSPSALQNQPVAYPASPGTRSGKPGNTSLLAMAQRQAALRAQQLAAQQANPSKAFNVKVGDFGGSGVFGVKTGDFGGPLAQNTTMTTTNIPTGGGGSSAGGLNGDFQQAYNQAKQANEARYQDVLQGYQQRYERGMGMLAGSGQQQGRDINELYDQQRTHNDQNLINRGLGNSTVLDTMRMGNERERNADLNRLNDSVRQQALSTDAGLSGDTLQFMERKTDAYPDMGLLAQLMQGLGAAGYGGGGGLGGGAYMAPGGGFNPAMMAGMGGGGGYSGPGGSNRPTQQQRAGYRASRKDLQDYYNFMNQMGVPISNPSQPPIVPWSGAGFNDAYANWAAAHGGEDPLRMGVFREDPINPATTMNGGY